MADKMSQAEIDLLLSQMTGGGTEAIAEASAIELSKKEVKPYSFANPSKFSKEQLRSMENVFDNYARLLSSFLTGYLRTSVHAEVMSADQTTYSDFSNILVNPVILSIIDLMPLKGSAIVELSATLGFAIIDRILGGPGVGIRKLRDFTEIEKILLDRVVSQMLTFIPEAWDNVYSVKPRLEKIETNASFAQILAPTEITALVMLSVKIGSIEGFLNFCIPHIMIEPIMDRFNTKFWYNKVGANDTVDVSNIIEKKLDSANIPVRVVLGGTQILVSDFVSLQKGDVIPLDSYVNSELKVYVGDIQKFNAKPGTSRGRYAAQITSRVEKEA